MATDLASVCPLTGDLPRKLQARLTQNRMSRKAWAIKIIKMFLPAFNTPQSREELSFRANRHFYPTSLFADKSSSHNSQGVKIK
jgi:hypothetical protein